ncbi:MAG: NADH-quinone oxidoreductase subunit NuoK [Roseiflexaceae bacterium]|jgi:NADH-quinone oxidoreductase subunit K|nr:MAG: NADH-quinone oxidoreductase subunit NuoK [Chloroflexota bacterium]RLT33405.1 MAG: NADH-quinone oxidoreductase subunit NuoK [Chloroflexota bacterium]
MVSTLMYVALSAILFVIGILGVTLRKSALMVFMSVELMLNAANLTLVAFANQWKSVDAQVMVFFVITVAAAEVAVGLALLVMIFKRKKTTDIDLMNTLRG